MGRADWIEHPEEGESTRSDAVAILQIGAGASGVVDASVREKVLREFRAFLADDKVTAIVLKGDKDSFVMSTSLEEPDDEDPRPDLGDLCDEIEASGKPVLAAIVGGAIGNGLEIALAAHFRVTTPTARFAAPEITLGLVPSGGATQRLPKLIGGIPALKMLLSGRPVNGVSAEKLGLVDIVVEDDPVAAAIAHADRLVASDAPRPRNSERRDRLGDQNGFLDAIRTHKAALRKGGSEAAARLIECVEASLLLPYEIGRGLEAAAFADLIAGDESRALRHVVAIERRMQIRTLQTGRAQSRPLKSIGVLGARGLGSEVVVAALDAGFAVTVAERNDEALEAGVTRIIEHYDARVAAGRMTDEAVEATLDRMNAVCGYKTFGDVDIVLDPGPRIARARISEIDSVLKAGAVFATGNEHVDLSRIAASTGRPSDIVGLKLFPGFARNRLVELSTLENTSPRAKETARACARKLGRLIVETGPTVHGVGSQLMTALHAASDIAAIEGASIGQVDEALRNWGMPLGSFAARDAAGLERALRDRQAGDVDTLLATVGRTGRSAGRGFYSYDKRGRAGDVDESVAEIIEEMRRERGITAKPVSGQQIMVACVAAMAGAGADMLLSGTVQRPSDIDMVSIHGLGFARRTGGVMNAADRIGLKKVRETLSRLADEDERITGPGDVLNDLIRAGKTFSDLEN